MTYDPRLEKEMGELKFEESTRQSLCRVRAMDPWPGADAALANGALKVWQARAAEINAAGSTPGTVLRSDTKDGLIIATGDGAMELVIIQAPNARRMDARAYLLGHSIDAGKPLCEVTL